jgi:NTP pyrophosphatase (non-canonical NTP hydrolase)
MTIAAYEQKAKETAMYPREQAITYTALGLAGEAGEVAELIKKMIRDDGSWLSWERKEKLRGELGDVLWYLAQLADAAGLSLEAVAQANVDKLSSRAVRGVISGDGSDR